MAKDMDMPSAPGGQATSTAKPGTVADTGSLSNSARPGALPGNTMGSVATKVYSSVQGPYVGGPNPDERLSGGPALPKLDLKKKVENPDEGDPDAKEPVVPQNPTGGTGTNSNPPKSPNINIKMPERKPYDPTQITMPGSPNQPYDPTRIQMPGANPTGYDPTQINMPGTQPPNWDPNTPLDMGTGAPTGDRQRLEQQLLHPEVADVDIGKLERYDPQPLIDLMRQEIDTAQRRSDQQIDRSINTQALDLNRALADAQDRYREQQGQIAADEMIARDNAALYAQARGDNGGIGQAQYGSIMNTAAQNRSRVASEQTKLASDTARQIADLRAAGEFQKADKMLELTQAALSELRQIEQYATDHNLSVDQFNLEMDRWKEQFRQSQEQYLTQLQMSLAEMTGTWGDGTPTYAAQQQAQQALANAALQMLNSGVSPDKLSQAQREALAATMGMDATGLSQWFSTMDDQNRKQEQSALAQTAMQMLEAGMDPSRLSSDMLSALQSIYGMDAAGIAGMYDALQQSQQQAKQQALANAALQMIQAGVDPSTLSADQLAALQTAGYSPEGLAGIYDQVTQDNNRSQQQSLAQMALQLVQGGMDPALLSQEQLAALQTLGFTAGSLGSLYDQARSPMADQGNVASAALQLIQSGVSPDKLSQDQLAALAAVYQLDADGLKELYRISTQK